ncbi:RNA polymerase sigma factor [Cellulomonas sp. NS3]|uniref:RNA polymerase sigma factor n=1 Tax=Cellulomonas sp. NS3 TaxID=2973977 RepID=UPI0021631EF8|nr:sigma-70 family RNA polymerase sigma factor [Cellulomonas sp. NS3]
MTTDVEGLLRRCAPQALGAVARRHADFAAAEDAVQEALLAAAQQWPRDGVPDNAVGWLVRVAARRLADEHREVTARRRREEVAAARDQRPPDDVEQHDDTLTVMLLCCHPALTPAAAIPLTLRAVGGLTTREIAAAFLVPEATMAQRISRAKATLRASDVPFAMPAPDDVPRRLALVRHVLYLLFNEGYATSAGPDLLRVDVTGEAIRLTRLLHAAVPDDAEVTGLLALLLLTEARRPARSGPHGELVPLAEQDRSLWDRALVVEGVRLATDALRAGRPGEHTLQACIAVLHDQAPSSGATDWPQVLALYDRLLALTGSPVVALHRAVAVAMVHGPARGLAALDGVAERLGSGHRLHAVRAHLLELDGRPRDAVDAYRHAAAAATNLREREYLTLRAARLA